MLKFACASTYIENVTCGITSFLTLLLMVYDTYYLKNIVPSCWHHHFLS